MPYSDTKTRKVRGRSWTQADEAHYRAQERRRLKRDQQAKEEHERFLAKLKAEGKLDAYLESEKQKRQAAEEQAKQIVLEREKKVELERLDKSAEARLMAGALQSEFASAIGWRDRYNQPEGDWLDDPVAALTTGYGFAEEVRTSRGIKMQINICLDCSNSMNHNGLSAVSLRTVRDMYLGLDMASRQLPDGSLVVNVWEWAHDADGKIVYRTTDDGRARQNDNPMGALVNWWPYFDGEDTWISPLLESLEKWEDTHGDPGAFRLDIIITDGVLEHATDARKGDEIQERRDGALQSVVLNFLPMADWSDSRVPKRCVQYPATPDNLIGLMRGVLGNWLVNLA